MISFDRFWRMMEETGTSTYYIREKCGLDNISSSTLRSMRKNQSVSTNALDSICRIFHCTLPDIVEFIEEEPESEAGPIRP